MYVPAPENQNIHTDIIIIGRRLQYYVLGRHIGRQCRIYRRRRKGDDKILFPGCGRTLEVPAQEVGRLGELPSHT